MKYFVRIGATDHVVTINGDTVEIDGQTVTARIEGIPGTPASLVAIGHEVHRVIARRGEGRGEYELDIGAYRFVAEALDERTRAIRELAGASGQAKGPAHLRAPMPGLIVRVHVGVGDAIQPGQGLVVMEAMKMENELRATAAGTVTRIVVVPGKAVEKGAILLEIE